MKTQETYQQRKELFDLVHSIGEVLEDKLHIIEWPAFGDDRKYRIYHAAGYCFDIERIRNYELEPGETQDDYLEPEFEYNYFEDFEGFKVLSIQQATAEMKKYHKKLKTSGK